MNSLSKSKTNNIIVQLGIEIEYIIRYVHFMKILFFLQPPPKQIPRTIENTREADETVCMPDDEEVNLLVYFLGKFVFFLYF